MKPYRIPAIQPALYRMSSAYYFKFIVAQFSTLLIQLFRLNSHDLP